MLKKCSRCGTLKQLEAFYKNKKSPDGRYTICKQCWGLRQKEYNQRPDVVERRRAYFSREDVRKKARELYYKNRDKYLSKKREYYKNNKKKVCENIAKYRSNPDVKARLDRWVKEYSKEYNQRPEVKKRKREYWHTEKAKERLKVRTSTEAYKEAMRQYTKKYRATDRARTKHCLYVRSRREDELFAFKERIRCLIGNSIKRKGHKKISKTQDIIGCSLDNLWQYLLTTWENNYGTKWDGEPYHIDHIIPLATAKTKEDVIKLCHHTNLQMLTPEDNLKKGDTLRHNS